MTAEDGCRLVLFTGPHARAPAHLATLRREAAGLALIRCRTLLEFARALKTAAWSLAVVDCGPGNPRLADVITIYRRSGAALPLVVVSEPSPQFGVATEGLDNCERVVPDDAEGLAKAVLRSCPRLAVAGSPPATAAGAAGPGAGAALDRAAFVESLRLPLRKDSASVVLLVLGVAPTASPTVLAGAAQAALAAASVPHGPVAALAPGRLGVLLDPCPMDAAQGVALAQALTKLLREHPRSAPEAAVALCPARSSDADAEQWLARAERACCDVAAHAEHGYAVLSRVPVVAPSGRTLPALVQEALAGNRLTLVFQPIVSLRGDVREHYEALIRLPTVAAGEMLPGDFLAAAEAAGLMPAIDQWVARAAVKRLVLERALHRRVHLFVALSAAGLQDGRVAMTLCDELAASGARGDWLTVQMRSRDVVQHAAAARRLVTDLRQIRCKVALDRYEHDVTAQEAVDALRFDFVKLSPGLTRGVTEDPERLATLSQVVRWLAGRDARSVATAVEDAQGLAYLWTAGVDYAQGYFLQEPAADIGYEPAG